MLSVDLFTFSTGYKPVSNTEMGFQLMLIEVVVNIFKLNPSQLLCQQHIGENLVSKVYVDHIPEPPRQELEVTINVMPDECTHLPKL